MYLDLVRFIVSIIRFNFFLQSCIGSQSQTLSRLAAAHRGAVRALQTFVSQAPLQPKVGHGSPPMYQELSALIRQLSLLAAQLHISGEDFSDEVKREKVQDEKVQYHSKVSRQSLLKTSSKLLGIKGQSSNHYQWQFLYVIWTNLCSSQFDFNEVENRLIFSVMPHSQWSSIYLIFFCILKSYFTFYWSGWAWWRRGCIESNWQNSRKSECIYPGSSWQKA